MPTEAQISQIQKLASFLYIIASIFIIEGVDLPLLCNDDNANTSNGDNTSNITDCEKKSEQLLFQGSATYLIGNILFLFTAMELLKQSEKEAQATGDIESVRPGKIITLGWVITVIGSIVRVYGRELKLSQLNSR